MTIPRLNGLWDEVGGSFMDFANKLPGIIHPNAKYLEQVRMELVKNPQLLSQLTEAEHNSPGTLNRLGLGGLADQASKTPVSSGLILERKKRQGLQTDLNPTQQESFVANLHGVESPLEIEKKRAEIEREKAQTAYTISNKTLTDIEAEVAAGTKNLKIEDAAMGLLKLKRLRESMDIVDAIKKNGKTPFESYLNNELTPEQIGAIHSVPEFEKAWQSEFMVWKQRQDAALDRARISLGYAQVASDGPERELAKQKARLAGNIAAYSGGRIDDVMAYQSLPPDERVQIDSMTEAPSDPNLLVLWNGANLSKKYGEKMARDDLRKDIRANNDVIKGNLSVLTRKDVSMQAKIAAINILNRTYEDIYSPYVSSGLLRDVPQIGYEPNWRGNPKEVFVTTNDPDVLDQLRANGLEVSGKAQNKANDLAVDKIDYDGIASEIISLSKTPQEISAYVNKLVKERGVDSVKLNVAITKKRDKK